MSIIVLVLVQWLHILMGIAWFGGYIFLDFVIWPTLLKRPAAEAQAVLSQISKYAGPLMMVSGTLVILLGIARGTLLGPITSFAFVFTTAYGLTWLAALAIALTLSIWGANWHTRWLRPVWEEDKVRPAAVRRLRAGTIFEMTCFGLVLACMVLMGSGL
jgi:uncharacterized membrane protein